MVGVQGHARQVGNRPSVNAPVAFQSAGPLLLNIDGPADKNALLASLIGATPAMLRGTDPLGYAHDVMRSWTTGTPLAQLASGGATDTAAADTGSPWYTRAGVIVLAIVLIGIGLYALVGQQLTAGAQKAAVLAA